MVKKEMLRGLNYTLTHIDSIANYTNLKDSEEVKRQMKYLKYLMDEYFAGVI